MKKITYLLGAGASANALPLIKHNPDANTLGLPQELKAFVQKHTSTFLTSNKDWDYRNIDVLKDIIDQCIEFGTPDLYAKFLLETGDNDSYQFLKTLLSVYFKYKQEIEQCFDFRALTFLTTICQNKKIPPNIKILTWNYDSQIEMAASRLRPVTSQKHEKIDGFTCWPNTRDGYVTQENPFILHLNGIAGATYSQKNFYDLIERNYDFTSCENKELLLSFAWEDETNSEKKIFNEQRLTVAKEIAYESKILVIIGYSFPFFNRNIDKEIMNAMIPNLDKIYFQDPYNDGSNLPGLFNMPTRLESNIVHISQKDNYHIPYEL